MKPGDGGSIANGGDITITGGRTATIEELEEQYREAFDRWTWETGSERDREILRALEHQIAIRKGWAASGFHWSPDGTKLYITGQHGIKKYTVSIPFDITTAA